MKASFSGSASQMSPTYGCASHTQSPLGCCRRSSTVQRRIDGSGSLKILHTFFNQGRFWATSYLGGGLLNKQQLRSIYKTTNGSRSREQTEVRVGQSEIVCFIRYLPKIYFQSRISDKTNILRSKSHPNKDKSAEAKQAESSLGEQKE